MAIPKYSKHSKFTYADYKTWPDDERWEIIEGVAYDMSPAPAVIHQRVLGRLYIEIDKALFEKTCEAFLSPFDVKLTAGTGSDDNDIDTVVQPDILVVCDREKLDDAGCNGAPDWIIEILSPSTAYKDQNEKLFLYEKHGVKEYWIIHPDAGMVFIYILDKDGIYKKPVVAKTGETVFVTVIPGMKIDLGRVFPS